MAAGRNGVNFHSRNRIVFLRKWSRAFSHATVESAPGRMTSQFGAVRPASPGSCRRVALSVECCTIAHVTKPLFRVVRKKREAIKVTEGHLRIL